MTCGATPVELKRSADPFCAKTRGTDETLLVGRDRGLRNVVVRLVGAPRTAPPATPARLVQDGCRYQPHVTGVVVGQTLAIATADPTLHNVHAYRDHATLFNFAQIPNTPDLQRRFDQPGLVELRCDVHPLMGGFVAVHENPWFAVTGDDGSFELRDVPAGTFTLEAWHERLGTKRITVTFDDREPATVAFEYVP
jgi:plastocyanin